jgi:hypothetical protein
MKSSAASSRPLGQSVGVPGLTPRIAKIEGATKASIGVSLGPRETAEDDWGNKLAPMG